MSEMSRPNRYRHRPTEVTAMELGEHNAVQIIGWLGILGHTAIRVDAGGIRISTPRGPVRVDVGEWVVAYGDGTVGKAGQEFDHDYERL